MGSDGGRAVSADGQWLVTWQDNEWIIDGPHDGPGMVWWSCPDESGLTAEMVLARWEREIEGQGTCVPEPLDDFDPDDYPLV